jgi:hypothetical protein
MECHSFINVGTNVLIHFLLIVSRLVTTPKGKLQHQKKMMTDLKMKSLENWIFLSWVKHHPEERLKQ